MNVHDLLRSEVEKVSSENFSWKSPDYKNPILIQISRVYRPHWTMRFPNMYDSASAPGIETGSAAWKLSMVPRRHNVIHLKRPELQLFMQANFSLQPIKEEVSIMAYKKYASWLYDSTPVQGSKPEPTACVILHFWLFIYQF